MGKASACGHKVVAVLQIDDVVALQAAACNGDLALVEVLVNNSENIHLQSYRFGIVLIAATYFGKIEFVRCLLRSALNPNVPNPIWSTRAYSAARYGEHTLRIAARDCSVGMARVALNSWADPNLPGPVHGTALCVAARRNLMRPGTISILLKYGANTNMRDTLFGTPLRAAAGSHRDNIAATEILIEHGADIHHQTKFIPHRAAQECNVRIMRILIDKRDC